MALPAFVVTDDEPWIERHVVPRSHAPTTKDRQPSARLNREDKFERLPFSQFE